AAAARFVRDGKRADLQDMTGHDGIIGRKRRCPASCMALLCTKIVSYSEKKLIGIAGAAFRWTIRAWICGASMSSLFLVNLKEHSAVFALLPVLSPVVHKAGEALGEAIQAGGKVMFCGNGGSAADSQHLAAELTGRF